MATRSTQADCRNQMDQARFEAEFIALMEPVRAFKKLLAASRPGTPEIETELDYLRSLARDVEVRRRKYQKIAQDAAYENSDRAFARECASTLELGELELRDCLPSG